MIFKRDEYIKENQEYINNLKNELIHLEALSNKLIAYKIDIKQKPWYKNIMEIYVPKAQVLALILIPQFY